MNDAMTNLSANEELKSIRPIRESVELQLFQTEPDWREHWWGMPEFEMKDASPQHRITVNFMTAKDVEDFAKVSGLPVTSISDTVWFPHQKPLAGEFEYNGPKTDSKYPICIPSKGRADCQKTGKALDRIGASYKFFVESDEYETYVKHLGADKVVSMPFNNLGEGSIPARNFIWEWCKERGHKRHWTVDDNINSFARTNYNRRLCVRGGGFFRAMEDYVDRYSNIAMAGPHHKGFVPDRNDRVGPYLLNSRIYSCILLDTTLNERWRGRYNEDTDLSLRLLKSGHCTLLFRALLMDKGGTASGAGKGGLKGGNTDNVYNSGDHRRAFAQSLADQHPDCVKVVWKFDRWHHEVDYSNFKHHKPLIKKGITPTKSVDNYGMTLTKVK